MSGYTVPASIDGSGSSDASVDINAFVASVPDASEIHFGAGLTYRLDAPIRLTQRHGLTIIGHDSRLRSTGDGASEASSLIWLDASTGITVSDLRLIGTWSGPYDRARAWQHGVLTDGGSDIELHDLKIRALWGDAFYVGSWATSVWIHDNVVRSTGRNGVTILSGRDVRVNRNRFDESGYCTWDIEPLYEDDGAVGIRFVNNVIGTWTNTLLSANGRHASVVQQVTVDRNTVTGSSLRTIIDLVTGRQDIMFTRNRSLVAPTNDYPVLQFRYIDGLTVTDNVQPLRAGPLYAIADSTRVVTG